MRRLCLTAVIGAAVVSSLVARAPATAPEPGAVARPAPFAAIVSSPYGTTTRVGCFEALSLRPTSAPVEIGEYHDTWGVSPDGTRVAMGISAPGREGRIGVRIVNLARWTVELDVETGIAAEAVAWLGDRALVAALQRGGIVLIDPVTGAEVRRWPGWPALDAPTIRTRRRFVLLDRRASRLAVVDATGRLRSVSLRLPLRSRRGQLERPALVADPVREHAYILTGGRVVVDVDLRRMRVRSHRLRPQPRERGAAPGALRRRHAVWLGRGLLAISGDDVVPRGWRLVTTAPAGLSTVDTESWNVRGVDARAIGVASAPGRLLAFGRRGLRGYTRTGRRVFEVLGRRAVWSVGTAGRLAYAVTPRATHVVDTRSGRVRRRIPRALELSLIAPRCPAGTG